MSIVITIILIITIIVGLGFIDIGIELCKHLFTSHVGIVCVIIGLLFIWASISNLLHISY